jgi:triacylglycerol lipase
LKYFFILVFLIQSLAGANTDPIFLIHGFLGWGRDEMNGYRYWGGKNDYQEDLRESGYNVFTLSVGPVSSNWDRAVEAYAQIKGGCVDYGMVHSDLFGIIQKPINKCYEGLYPQWDENNPIHLIGHSQGGLTARMLEHLLQNSYPDETSLLLKNSSDGWITSVTTIATPHDGTTLAPIIMDIFPFAQSMSSWVLPLSNTFLKKIYRFDLEQWGLVIDKNKKSVDFWKEIGKSKIRDSKNFCTWDLSLEGAKAFNTLYRTNQSVYYFSFSSFATKKVPQSNYHRPDSKMLLTLRPASLLIGKSNEIDSTWNKNDGIVNTISMAAPTSGMHGPEPVQDYNGIPQKGVWQKTKELHMNHHSVIGVHLSKKKSAEVLELYKKHCNLLYSL